MVESSPNLQKQQQERLLNLLQKKLGIFMAFDTAEQEGDCFRNKEIGFSIEWHTELKSVYNKKLQT